ncbi:glycerophosphodiester phosphodiesterase [Synoicihabitans lomoniglobus]|uniref:Glycerophosphodiester phosphodiesterase family protein n=1 Tax=Synoicihabitans lomoniglobus TaxID=2909285 RepID=A0AAF0CQX9_9BACT|nr:hypothetical protein [Opitutaceae bacterium LMO-M01]WED66423.1 glycerophosphodiester phosphodiesterase family protein [Opitutaceae bacterium LMO-M01]
MHSFRLTFWTLILTTTVLWLGCASTPAVEAWSHPSESRAEALLAQPRPLIIAHRGFSEWAPENTLPAFALAIHAEADLVELDYHVTADGVPVVFHDYTLDRTSNAVAQWGGSDWQLEAQPAHVLTDLDAGGWFSSAYAGAKLPTLNESLDFIQGAGGVTLIERKAGSAADCAEIIHAKRLINDVVVQAFDWEFLAALHDAIPTQVLGALGPQKEWDGRKLAAAEKTLSPLWVERAAKSGVRVIGWNRHITAEAVAAAHARGLKIWVYTINELPAAKALLALGVDGIITNNPLRISRLRK